MDWISRATEPEAGLESGLSTTASCRGHQRTATLLTKNTRDITKAIIRCVLHHMVVIIACSGSRNTHNVRANVSRYASAANSNANVGLKYIEITPRQFYEAKRLFLSIHVGYLLQLGISSGILSEN